MPGKHFNRSGDIMWAYLEEDFLTESNQEEYINPFEASKVGDKKPSIRAELIDRRENFDFNFPQSPTDEDKIELPNSPALNPAMYSNVLLHSGEFVWDDIDLRIPGRGFDFVFHRTYRSQAMYSGVLGWGWDHNYNKRLLELYSGDILYYDGTGRRERFKAIKEGETIIGYTPPKGWFVDFKKKDDGLFCLIYPDRTIESFDPAGRLVSIRDRNQNKMEFFYNVSGQLSVVMDTMGRLIYFDYEPFETEVINQDTGETIVKVNSCRLMEIRDFSDRVATFKYDNKGDLKGVDFEGREKQYSYSQVDDIKYAHNLETITSAENKPELALNYVDDKVTTMYNGSLQGTQTGFSISESSSVVTLPKGNTRTFTLKDERIETIKEGTGSKPTTYTYKAKDGLLDTVTYPEGNSETYTYAEGVDVDRLSAGNLLNISETADMVRGTNGNTREPTKFTYDNFTNQVKTITYPNGLKVENSEPDDNGNFQKVKASAPDYPEMESLEYEYKFNRFGQIKSETNFFGMKTTYNYYSEEVPGGDSKTVSGRLLEDTGGYLKEIVSPINTHNFTKYDQRGNLEDYSNSMDVKGHYSSNKYDELETEELISTGSLSPMSYNATYQHYKDGNLDWHETTFSTGSGEVNRKTDYQYTSRNMLDIVNETLTTPTDTKTITTDYGYDLNDNLTSLSNGMDSISFGYNDRDLVESVTLGTGANATSVSYTYDANGNVLTVTDHFGHQTVYSYDGYDRLKQVKDPLNNMTLLTLFDKGNKLEIKNLDSAENILRESIRINDPLGRMKSYEVKLPGGQSESYQYTYTDGYKTITITDSLNRSWTYKRNEKGQVYFEQDPAGNFTNYFYEDPWGSITKKEEHEKLPDGTEKVHVTKFKYNSQGKIEEIRELMNEDDPNQEDDEKDLITTFYYDGCGNLTGSTDAEGNKISHEYDGFNRKTLTTRYLKNGEKIETSFTYYDNNLPKTITDDKGNITEYKYDDQKRLTKVIYPDESFIEITYTKVTKDDQDYKRVIITQRNGTIVTNDYDKAGRLVNRTIQKGEDVEGSTFENFAYDGLNRLNYAENDNFVVEFKFDPLNRITEEKQRGKLLNYTYSVVNNLRQMTMKYPNDLLIEKNFDILDRLSNIKQGDNDIANLKYIGRSYRLLSKQFGNGDAVSYLYDQGRRMTEKKAVNKNLDLINHYKYGYNKVHMKNYEQRMHENGIGDVFGYDAVYRLTNAKFNVPDPTAANPTDFEKERNIFLDHVDNITRIDETKNGETTQITTDIPLDTDFLKLNQYSRFDQWGLAYDKNGNLTQKGTQKMYFDFRNQMVRVTEGTTTTENKYDALGRRLEKIVTAGSQSKTENYYYAGHQVIEVRDGSDQVKRQFIYGNSIDEVIRMDAYNGSTITPYYFHRNEIGSTTAVTDANGQVVERYKYGLYGMPTFMDAAGNVIPNSAIGNNILFQGREYEPETNFYYFRARHLDPIMGRFLQTDPMGYQDSLNLYQAFNMNPVNFVDPFGEESYLDFLSRKIAEMRSRGYSEAFINRIMDELKSGYLAKVDYRNSYVDEMPGVNDSFYEGVVDKFLSTKKKIFDFFRNLTDPDTMAVNLENLPENVRNKAVNFSNRISDLLNKGDIFAVQKAFIQELYEASPIPDYTVAVDPNSTTDESSSALANYTLKMLAIIFTAKELKTPTNDLPALKPGEGNVIRNKLLTHEYNFANEIVNFRGGSFVGPTRKSMQAIDGFLDGVPAQLKEMIGKSPTAVSKYVRIAGEKALKGGYTNVELFIKAINVTKEAILIGPIRKILMQQSSLGAINILTKNGWVRFIR